MSDKHSLGDSKIDNLEKSAPNNTMVSWYGGIYDRFHLKIKGLIYLMPGFSWLTLFLLVPSLALIALSFASKGNFGDINWVFTLDNYKRILGFSSFGWNPAYIYILLRSLWIAFITTFICVLLAYPLTFFIASRPKTTRSLWLLLIIVPFWTNVVVRTYAWLLILNPQMPLAKILAAMGLVAKGAPLYPGAFAVYLGMVSTFLPFMTLPLYASVERLDWSLLDAAKDLYANKWQIFRQAILPQTMPGLSVGLIVTFIPAMAMFVVTDILGGAKYMLVGNVIQQQFSHTRDWPFGAALCLSLMILTMASLAIYRKKYSGR